MAQLIKKIIESDNLACKNPDDTSIAIQYMVGFANNRVEKRANVYKYLEKTLEQLKTALLDTEKRLKEIHKK